MRVKDAGTYSRNWSCEHLSCIDEGPVVLVTVALNLYYRG